MYYISCVTRINTCIVLNHFFLFYTILCGGDSKFLCFVFIVYSKQSLYYVNKTNSARTNVVIQKGLLLLYTRTNQEPILMVAVLLLANSL